MSKELTEKKEQLPAYLVDTKDEAKEIIREFAPFVKPPRVKIYQRMSRIDGFVLGDILITPKNIKIGDEKEFFSFTPIHFYPSWSCLNPMGSGLPVIHEFSVDPKSDICRKAKSFHSEPCPGTDKTRKWRESLEWFCIIWGVKEYEMTPVIFSFRSGSYQRGQNLMGTIDAREVVPYMQKFKCCSEPDDKYGKEKEFHAPVIMKDGFVEEKYMEEFKKLREQLKEGIEANQFDLESGIGEDEVTAPSDKF